MPDKTSGIMAFVDFYFLTLFKQRINCPLFSLHYYKINIKYFYHANEDLQLTKDDKQKNEQGFCVFWAQDFHCSP